MSITARITITSGPDRGKVFELNDQLVNIGRASENDVALSDPLVSDHQASITSRGGRYAIYTPLERVVEVDGNVIPADRWVWLPKSARVRVSDRTAFQFSYQGGAKVAAKRPEKRKRNVARFITDQSGDPLVKLGEDGHLPELALTEGPNKKTLQKRGKQSNPTLLYAAVAFSVCASVAMLFLDAEPSGSSASQKAQARRAIAGFYETGESEPQEYQRSLRDAQLAHSRNDSIAERRAYRRVLVLLNSEDNNRFTGLTGGPERDERLRKLIAILLSN